MVAHALTGEVERVGFAIDRDSIPAQVFGLESYEDPIAPVARISRREAIQAPAVKRVRDLIAGSIGQLPLDVYDSERVQLVNDLLPQPEQNRGRTVTMTRTVEDILFEGIAWWRVVERAWDGYPRYVRRIDPWRVEVDEAKGVVHIDGQVVPDADLIRFDSPNDPLLVAGARAIRTLLKLDATAAQYADDPQAREYFVPAEGADPAEDDEIREVLTNWRDARKKRSVGYVPAALRLEQGNLISPRDLQLADARNHAVLEVARLASVDPEELGVSTTSRTYANQFDRRKAYIDFTLGPYMRAIEERLSMGDVTKRGNYVRFNLGAFLRSDTLSRYQAYAAGLAVGAIGKHEIRELEDKPALTEDQMPETLPAPQLSQFDGEQVALTAEPVSAAFSVDMDKRTITGLLVPFGKTGRSGGKVWTFGADSMVWDDPTRVKLLMDHDFKQAVGHATALDKRSDGIYAKFKVARGDAGDRALILAEDKVYDGLSAGVGHGGKLTASNGVHTFSGAPLIEGSLTPIPAFDDARVHAVAGSAVPEGNAMKCTKCGQLHAAGVTECDAAAVAAFEADKQTITFTAEQHAALLAMLPKAPEPKPAEGPAVISASEGGTFSVTEPAPYRFDGIRGEHDFSTDLFAGARGDSEAMQRATKFTQDAFLQAATFDVDSANVASLNPARNRPEMYVDQKAYVTPFYDALYKGTLADQTPFTFPKFTSASGLVADHVEGVEPTPGTFVAGSQTVTPTASSGKVEITREVFDAGGNPQVSTLIWNKMVRAWYEALEAKAVGVLDAASPTAIPLTTAAADDDLVNELEAAIAALQFIRGGNTFNFAGTHIDLYKKLAAAVDSTGRKLLPMYGPANANGQARSRFGSLDVAGVEFVPAWSLGASGTVSESSYLVDTNDVHVWNTAPQRLEFQYRVAYVDLAIWGYSAAAISDLTGVREITYDPAA